MWGGGEEVRLPPIEFDDAGQAGAAEQGVEAERGDDERVVRAGEAAERGQVAVIVVIMAEEDGIDLRQRFEKEARCVHATRTDPAEEADAFAEDRIGEQGKTGELEEDGGMVDPGCDDFGRVGGRRCGRGARGAG